MKKTIKEDIEEIYYKQIFINDNALLIYTEKDENNIDIKLRYIANNTIREQQLITITKEDFILGEDPLEINDNNDAIAIYKKENGKRYLHRLYFVDVYTFAINDFIDLEYKRKFSKEPVYELVKEKR